MLKLLSKFVLEILPGVAASVIGAYLVHHFITAPDQPETPATKQVIALPKEDVEKLLSAVQQTLRTATEASTTSAAPSDPAIPEPAPAPAPRETTSAPVSPRAPEATAAVPAPRAPESPMVRRPPAQPRLATTSPSTPPSGSGSSAATPMSPVVPTAATPMSPVVVATPLSPPPGAYPASPGSYTAPSSSYGIPSSNPYGAPAPSPYPPPGSAMMSPPSGNGSVPVIRADLSPPAAELNGPMVLTAPPGEASAPPRETGDPVQLSPSDRARLSDIPYPPGAMPPPDRKERPHSVLDWGGKIVGGVVKGVTSVLPDFSQH